MDRNTVIGLLLIAVILIGYGLWSKPSKEKMQEAQRIRDSLNTVQAQQIQEEQVKKDTQQKLAEPAFEGSKTISDTTSKQNLADKYGVFAGAAAGSDYKITLENNLVRIDISTRGGRPYFVQLKDYQTFDSLPLILLEGDSTVFGLKFFAGNRSINTNELFFTPARKERKIVVGEQPESLSMRLLAGENSYIEFIYTLAANAYMVDFDMHFVNMNEVLSDKINYLDLNWEQYAPGHEQGRVNEMNYTNLVFKHYQDEIERFNNRSKKEIQDEDITTRIEWIAYKQQFFSSVLIAENYFNSAYLSMTKLGDTGKYLKYYSSQISVPYESKPDYSVQMDFYFGPNHTQTLKRYGHQLNELVNLGGPLSRVINRYFLIPIFNWLEKFIRSYGLIILVLTIIIKIILFPLTYRSYLSMAKMRVLKPEIDAINEKIPKDKAMERQQATMALYKKAGVSPLGGCLPMLLQMPILYAMFRFFPSSIELRQESFLWAHDLSTYDSIIDLPFNIPMYGDHVSLFTLLMTASTILTMKISNQASASSQQMPGMKGMMYIMPIMFMFILNNFSAALTYYYFLANIITFGQNYISKQFIDEEELRRKLQTNTKKSAPKKSGFQKRLEDMAKKRGYNAPKKR